MKQLTPDEIEMMRRARDDAARAAGSSAPACSPFTSRPVNDGPSLRDAVRRALAKWDRSGDTYRFQNDVRFAVAAYDYNTKANPTGQAADHKNGG